MSLYQPVFYFISFLFIHAFPSLTKGEKKLILNGRSLRMQSDTWATIDDIRNSFLLGIHTFPFNRWYWFELNTNQKNVYRIMVSKRILNKTIYLNVIRIHYLAKECEFVSKLLPGKCNFANMIRYFLSNFIGKFWNQ